ncbi:hypothetical protein M2145_001426 [Lachnospiraceae bacterium PF1-21]|uniref:DUF3343 domain-containing protein n=1 Tax=Ohessyouella blattaphilus TaxID=2949333 RepID=A0ABT1EIQ1_9FIRM|nr:DUF3343 domain-containing protein [Ohessyouella blattaphilus]MCP1110580.1 DUF3343 domain-containing protein [Ohessyouella blattaphilus]MCR8563974.1 DUF3343 domain-containing protein [Ohessyouella blattaphilus]MDL2249576.1 DUF3343 domain-containing protein [Lachnospiraceae bacterium OttesenSCG-928-J05]
MRKKELKLVVTFHTTAEAMALEKAAKERSLLGRMIPVPRELSSGCGISWTSPLELREELLSLMEELQIEKDEIHEIMV